jgi:hypothetical protein
MEGDMRFKAEINFVVLVAVFCLVGALGCGDDDSNAVDGGTDAGICDGVICDPPDSCIEYFIDSDSGYITVLETPVAGTCVPNSGQCMYNQSFSYMECEFGCIEQPGDDVCATDEHYTGIGMSCATHADCASYDATFCSPGGECTIENCDETVCPDSYTCCGPCALLEYKRVCVPDTSVGLGEDIGCPCD